MKNIYPVMYDRESVGSTNYREVGLSSGRMQIHTITRAVSRKPCALLFTLFSAQFLVHLLSNGGDRGLRLRVIILLRQYSFDGCFLFACDELTASL